VARLTEHDDVITPLLRGGPRLGLTLGPALARASPAPPNQFCQFLLQTNFSFRCTNNDLSWMIVPDSKCYWVFLLF